MPWSADKGPESLDATLWQFSGLGDHSLLRGRMPDSSVRKTSDIPGMGGPDLDFRTAVTVIWDRIRSARCTKNSTQFTNADLAFCWMFLRAVPDQDQELPPDHMDDQFAPKEEINLFKTAQTHGCCLLFMR